MPLGGRDRREAQPSRRSRAGCLNFERGRKDETPFRVGKRLPRQRWELEAVRPERRLAGRKSGNGSKNPSPFLESFRYDIFGTIALIAFIVKSACAPFHSLRLSKIAVGICATVTENGQDPAVWAGCETLPATRCRR
jgi:hypothetical protein